ncbi:hypothetical protein SUDANB105_00031 [Streptomyces sp. enrichment culture]|uniref:hypothetical protein n=1 Tax=Streptomyces sp. enrichment culture TaxID=1795815 RepID=UPI003F577BBA
MSSLDQLKSLLGTPPGRQPGPDDWAEVEQYVGAALPDDFNAFLDAYGSGVLSDELVVLHPRGSSPLLERMHRIRLAFAERRERAACDGNCQHIPYRFHPTPGGLISWGWAGNCRFD